MKISVILTTCDRPEYVREAIDSYLSQDYLDSECIIVNDGKKHYDHPSIEKDGRITEITTVGYRGQAFSLNSGISRATGDLICWLCDDDMFSDHESLSNRAKLFRRESQTQLIATAWEEINAQGEHIAYHTPKPISAARSWRKETLNLAAAMWKREVTDKIKFNANLKYYIDWDFKIRTAMEFECLTSHIVTAKYRVHSGQAGVRRRAEKADSKEYTRMMYDIGHDYGDIRKAHP